MTGSDLFQRLLQNVPGASMTGFLYEVNAELLRLWMGRAWQYYQAEVSMTTTHSFSNLTITNGAERATVVDSDGGGLFHALHIGKTFTIEDVGYTVYGVTDGDTLELDGLYDFDGGSNPESGTLPRVAFPLPSSAGLVFARMVKIYLDGEEELGAIHDPAQYVVTSQEIQLRQILTGATDYIVRYLRRPAVVSSLATTLDVSADLEEVLYRGLEGRYLRRTVPRSEFEMLGWQRRVSESEQLHEAARKAAAAAETLRRVERRQNARGVV